MDRLVASYEAEYGEISESLRTASMLRFRDLIQETASEYGRMENFCRIYPARNSKLYDKFFSGNKQLNKIIYRTFYTSEILSYNSKNGDKTGVLNPSKASDL